MTLYEHIQLACGARGVILPAQPHDRSMMGGISEGIEDWTQAREAAMCRDLASWPSELLERASVMLATAAIEAAKREAGQ